ncbi:hypothetical protein [Streptococcus uberis]|uniref:hypothetical protein n=1 Tax=Streptococcus uberis TaxID=1349 RepID=UPI0033657F14
MVFSIRFLFRSNATRWGPDLSARIVISFLHNKKPPQLVTIRRLATLDLILSSYGVTLPIGTVGIEPTQYTTTSLEPSPMHEALPLPFSNHGSCSY